MAAPDLGLETPVKFVNFKCFLCLTTTASTVFSLAGRKCKEQEFECKLRSVLGEENADLLNDFLRRHGSVLDVRENVCDSGPDLAVCRNCFHKVSSSHAWKQGIVENISIFGQSTRTKRMAKFSPGVVPSKQRTVSVGVGSARRVDVDDVVVPSTSYSNVRTDGDGDFDDSFVSGFSDLNSLIYDDKDNANDVASSKVSRRLSKAFTSLPQPQNQDKESSSSAANKSTGLFDMFEHSYASVNIEKEHKTNLASRKVEVQAIFDRVGLNSNKSYSFKALSSFELDSTLVANLVAALLRQDTVKVMEVFLGSEIFRKMMKTSILEELNRQCTAMQSRNAAFASVLQTKKEISRLDQEADVFLLDLIQEMDSRVPFLLDLITTMIRGSGMKNLTVEQHVGPIASVYGLLMSARSQKLSAWKKLVTVVGLRAHMEDTGVTRFNHLGLMQSTTSKLRIVEEAAGEADNRIVAELKQNPLIKLTGDNLDIRVKTGQQSTQQHHKDLHYFVSNVIFSRVATPDLSTVKVPVDPSTVQPDMLLPHDAHEQRLLHGYMIIIARLLSDIPAFQWMKSVIPEHIEHPYSAKMAKKSKVYPLQIMFKNEAKHDDCIDVLDMYEELLIKYHEEAIGNTDILHHARVPVGGDQLTRVRFQEVKQLRSLAPDPVKRFADLDPIIIEMWHMKQDLLEKSYKLLFDKASLRQPGTLYYFKSRLMRTDVNGKVKSAMKAHHDLLLLVGEQMIREQALEYFGITEESPLPTRNQPPEGIETKTKRTRYDVMEKLIHGFMDHYGYGQFSLTGFASKPATPHAAPEVQEVIGVTPDGKLVVKMKPPSAQLPDEVFNYSLNLCHWALHIMELNDTAHEGDLTRVVPNCMYSIPFFYSHSRLSKYFIECMDYIIKVEHVLSPLQRMLVLEGSFVNSHGGAGSNVEADLKQEHSVRNEKEQIRRLGANKTETAVVRATRAADTIVNITNLLDNCLNIKAPSGHHTKSPREKDRDIIQKALRDLRPFRFTAGRVCNGMKNITKSPFERINLVDMRDRMAYTATRLLWGEVPDVVDDEESDHLSDGD